MDAGDPVASVSRGVPVTDTGSLNVTVTGTTWPARYRPSVRVEETPPVTVGAVVSMTMSFDAPSDPSVPGATRVRFAFLLATSLMVPPLRANELVAA